jgi:fatty-acyl-CoA synthase
MNAPDDAVARLYDHAPMRTLQDVEAMERVPLETRIPWWNLNDWLKHGFELAPQKPALHYIEDGDPASPCLSIAYRELQRRSNQAANLFHSLGVGPGDVVFFLLPTVPQLFVVTLGAVQAGIACGANWMLKADHMLELIQSSRAKLVIALGPTAGYEIWENLEAIRAQLHGVQILSVQGPGGRKLPGSDLDAQLERQPGERLTFARSVSPDDIAAYVHSGGTTGAPKLVKLTHRGMAYKCWANAWVMAHTPDDVIFADYPMFHIAGIFGRGILALANGMSIVIPTPNGARDKRFIANYWKFVEKFRISLLSGVPTTLSVLAKNPPTTEDISSMRKYMCTGSTAMPAEVAREIEAATGVRVLATYGATEFTQNVTQGPRDGDPRYGSGGLRLPYTEVKIVRLDEQGEIERECAVDEIGVVLVRGPSVTLGYVDPKYNEGLFVKGGWINNGDLGRIDADGYLWLTGRAKDLIIRGGHNIDPTVIEETLRRHKAVLLVAAVSKPDAYAGELPVAYVQLVKGSQASGAELAAFVREHISERAAAPKEVYVLDEMPLTDVGKPSKVQLRQDAGRRAFLAALMHSLGPGTPMDVQVGPHPIHGTLATIRLPASGRHSAELEQKVHEVMKAYTMPYVLEWN